MKAWLAIRDTAGGLISKALIWGLDTMFLTPDILTGMFMESVGSQQSQSCLKMLTPGPDSRLIESFQLVFFL